MYLCPWPSLCSSPRVGDRARLRDSIVLPGTQIAADAILIGAIAGHSGIVQSLRRRFAQAVS